MSALDLFKHENGTDLKTPEFQLLTADSVDMLLKEINHGKVPTMNSEPTSDTVSPIKPLSCALSKDPEQRRDFNSSSDTYVSDARVLDHMDSFARNFEPDSSAELSQAFLLVQDAVTAKPRDMPAQVLREDKGEETQQSHADAAESPKQRQLDLYELDELGELNELDHKQNSKTNQKLNQKLDILDPTAEKSSPTQERHTAHVHTDPGASPSKSIMKGRGLASPKKNVAFLDGPHIQTFHSDPTGESSTQRVQVSPQRHLWTEVSQQSSDDARDASQAPVPPPHASNRTSSYLGNNVGAADPAFPANGPAFSANTVDDNVDDPDISRLTEYRLTDKNFSNLSLNEKIEVFLINKLHDELSEHLDKLDSAARDKTAANVHRLSFQIEQHGTPLEDPLNALTPGLTYCIPSAHSSQSSLQSLVDSNRCLQLNHVEKHLRGLQLNDGIKGFSDKLAAEIFPTTVDSAESGTETSAEQAEGLSRARDLLPLRFDQSQTEKSIMHLLESVWQIEPAHAGLTAPVETLPETLAPEKPQDKHSADVASPTRGPGSRDTSPRGSHRTVKLEPEEGPAQEVHVKQEHVKQEPWEHVASEKVVSEPRVKSESPEPRIEIEPEFDPVVKLEPLDRVVKSEPSDAVKSEPHDNVQEGTEHLQDDASLKREPLQLKPGRKVLRADSMDHLPYHFADSNGGTIVVQVGQKILPGQVRLVGPITSPHSDEGWGSSGHGDTTDSFAGKTHESADVPRQVLETQHHTAGQAVFTGRDYVHELLDPAAVGPEPEKTGTEPQTRPVQTGTDSESNPTDLDLSVLANSSNVQPPVNIKLPALELGSSEFDYLSKKLSEKSLYEEALLAEHDAEKRPLNFLSIWHSQQLSGKTAPRMQKQFYQVPSLLSYNTADLSQYAKYAVPRTLKPKKFQEVNVVSSRVVGTTYENLYDSQFLPELSQDSGIGDHFEQFLQRVSAEHDAVTTTLKRRSSGPSGRAPARSTFRASSPSFTTLRPCDNDYGRTCGNTKKSRFTVHLFEIERSLSVLSPKNMYNDIFHDGSVVKPTIKAPVMKTMPREDRDQFQRIMDMKDAVAHTGVSQLKAVGKTAIPDNKTALVHEWMQQAASLHCDSMLFEGDGAAAIGNGTTGNNHAKKDAGKDARKKVMEKVMRQDASVTQKNVSVMVKNVSVEKARAPGSRNPFLVSDDQVTAARAPLAVLKQRQTRTNVPTLVDTPVVRASFDGGFARTRSPERTGDRNARGSPIKISLPVKLVKKDGLVKGIVLGRKASELNADVAPAPTTETKGKLASSAVSVPTVLTADTLMATAVEVMLQDGGPLGNMSRTVSGEKALAPEAQPLERGRLFLRVVGLNKIALPGIADRVMAFTITLDNGVHCVTTPSYDTCGRASVIIGKEFELTVNRSLQFILTLKATYSRPPPTYVEVKERCVLQPRKRFSRLFGSKEVKTTTRIVPRDTPDPWDRLIAPDGLFARCYIDVGEYMAQVSGVARTLTFTCFNEWATVQGASLLSSYTVAQLEVKMLFVPRTEPHEIMPLSIKSAYECLDDLRREMRRVLEGYLHQEGGDCDTWKKRWFRLQGTSLIAHSEYSHKTRAKINLANVAEVVYVDTQGCIRVPGGRNFSDILLMQHAFKIRFADGEVIEFGAPNAAEKMQWIQAIQEIVYRNKFRRMPWVHTMLEKNSAPAE
ncbi:DUF1709-domain-containing protein [Metschnikowia bicuspidata]|uniref:DUF1709-domain-containing protein n=1 Tax=Metschnikowia bicuspidata TaxID=27322 RepID=A0A4V1J2U2_9ASCO|nr:DUF1709-domain-containing protein [Metschnikowia bicuspidata]